MKLTANVEKVTAKQAALFLTNNPMNRQLQHHLVARYASQMREGNWQLVPAPICFSKEGFLLQGQHRLSAQVMSETAQEYLVCRDLDKEVFSLLDTGRSRNNTDVLYIKGFNYPELYGSLILQYLKYERGVFWGHGNKAVKPMPSEVLDYAEANRDDLALTVNYVKTVKRRSTYFSERVFASSYHIIRKHTAKDVVDVQKFFNELINGEEDELHISMSWLRDELTVDKKSSRKLRWQNIYASIFYSWNGWIGKGKFVPVNPESCRDVEPN